jgi:glycosyltransferase involved in cell wall biosynthesis
LDLSICIPVFNRNVGDLVRNLHAQIEQLNKNIEILLYDDASDEALKTENRKWKNSPSIQYKELDKNIGRSAIRNMLFTDAKAPFLLFIDCDMMVVDTEFLNRYLNNTLEGVVCGGHIYDASAPSDSFKLHWLYGRKKEVVNVNKRNKSPYLSFKTSNFLISKSVFDQIQFNEDLVKYGHEDTLFGFELESKSIPIKHIDNPLVHLGLEKSEMFIEKTEKAIDNLIRIHQSFPLIRSRVKVLDAYYKLNRLGLSGRLRTNYERNRDKWLINLKSKSPSLKLLQRYKLGYLASKDF